MVIFTFPQFEYLFRESRPLPAHAGSFAANQYDNGEWHIEIETDVARQDCMIIGTIAPPEQNIIKFLQLAHTLKKEGALRVVAVLPYLAYARHDNDLPGKSLGIAWVGSILQASGFDEVMAIDVHSELDTELLPIPLVSVLPDQIWADEINELKDARITLVAADQGAIGRCQAVANAADIERPIAYLKKQRNNGIVYHQLAGEVLERAVIVDDILDTGSTLISCVQKLQAAGAKELTVAVSHGIFTGSKWRQLWNLGVKKIYCLDTIPGAITIDDSRIQVVASGQLIHSEILREKMAAGGES